MEDKILMVLKKHGNSIEVIKQQYGDNLDYYKELLKIFVEDSLFDNLINALAHHELNRAYELSDMYWKILGTLCLNNLMEQYSSIYVKAKGKKTIESEEIDKCKRQYHQFIRELRYSM